MAHTRRARHSLRFLAEHTAVIVVYLEAAYCRTAVERPGMTAVYSAAAAEYSAVGPVYLEMVPEYSEMED